ncbi:hypothetical protein PSD17_50350 [Pseudonocardia sp. D17]|nr:hypothetical protein PSD17_50350 [Pseudonocardia sp. D17]
MCRILLPLETRVNPSAPGGPRSGSPELQERHFPATRLRKVPFLQGRRGLRRRAAHPQQALQAPSTGRRTPLTYRAASEIR